MKASVRSAKHLPKKLLIGGSVILVIAAIIGGLFISKPEDQNNKPSQVTQKPEDCSMVNENIVNKAKGDIAKVDYASIKADINVNKLCQIPNTYKTLSSQQKLDYYQASLNLSILAYKAKDANASKQFAQSALALYSLLPDDVRAAKQSSYEFQQVQNLYNGTYS